MAIQTLVSTKKTLHIGIELTKGTTVAASAALITTDPEMMDEAEYIERKGPGLHMGWGYGGLVSENRGACNFKTELVGNGSNALDPALSILLQACNLTNASEVYSPSATIAVQETCTIILYEDGLKKTLSGAMGDVSIEFVRGKPAVCSFSMVGAYVEADGAMPAFSPNTTTPPNFDNSGTYSYDGTAGLCFQNATFETANVLAWHCGAAGPHYVCTDRKPTITCDPEMQLEADYAFDTKWRAGTTASLSIALGTGAGNKITFAIDDFQLSESPKSAERDGIAIYNISGNCLPTSAGNDEVTLTVQTS